MKKPIEGKLRRQTQEIPNQKNAAKVFIHPTVLLESGLQDGQLCTIESVASGKRLEGVAWHNTDKNIAKGILALSETLRVSGHLDLGDIIRITDAGDVPDADTIVVREVSSDSTPSLSQVDRNHWSYFIEGRFEAAEYIFSGLTLGDLSLKGPKRSFVVESVNGSKGNVARFCRSTRAEWFDENAAGVNGGVASKLEVKDIPGMDAPLNDLNSFLRYFDGRPAKPNVVPSCGIVIQGSRGTGKSMILDRIATTRWGKVVNITRTDKPSTILDYFTNAIDSRRPTLILVDDIEELVGKGRPNRDGAIDAFKNGLADLAALMMKEKTRPSVVVIATCRNFLEDIPESLQAGEIFDSHITLPIPDSSARKEIIRYHNPYFSPEHFEQYISDLGDRTHAYTGKDLKKLIVRACGISDRRTGDYSEGNPMIWSDVQKALQEVPPTAMHDITLKPPNIRWNDIGGYQDVKSTLQRVLTGPMAGRPKWKPPKGVLLYGPPGCSKTMTAQAMATELGFNFFAVKGGELLNMYVGETERSIRNLFKRAREASPSIIFFDEIDSIASSRTGSSGGGGVQAVTTLLTEMDGFEQMGDIFVLAATNKPDSLDPALLRPGRFDELIYVPLPDEQARRAILLHKSKELWLPYIVVDVDELAKQTSGYSGAEITRICDRAFMNFGDNETTDGVTEGMSVLETAIRNTPKRVTKDMLDQYSRWHESRVK